MEKATATLIAKLLIDCPKCGQTFDLFDHNDEGEYSEPIFNNDWDDLNDADVICPDCEYEFQIKNIEY